MSEEAMEDERCDQKTKVTENQRSMNDYCIADCWRWDIVMLQAAQLMTCMHTCVPSEDNGDNTGLVLSNALEDWLREIKMLLGRVAPAAGVVGQSIVWRTEIGGGHHDVAGKAHSAIHTLYHIASPAAKTTIKESRAQRGRVSPVALAVKVSVPTCTACKCRYEKRKKEPNS